LIGLQKKNDLNKSGDKKAGSEGDEASEDAYVDDFEEQSASSANTLAKASVSQSGRLPPLSSSYP